LSLIASPSGFRRDMQLVNALNVSNARDEIPGIRAGDRPRLRIPALIDIVNDVFSLPFPSGSLVVIWVDVVLLAHNDSIGLKGLNSL